MSSDDSILVALPKDQYDIYLKLISDFDAKNSEDNTKNSDNKEVEGVDNIDEKDKAFIECPEKDTQVAIETKDKIPPATVCDSETDVGPLNADADSHASDISGGSSNDRHNYETGSLCEFQESPPSKAKTQKKSPTTTKNGKAKKEVPEKKIKKKVLNNNVQSAINEAKCLVNKKHQKRFARFQHEIESDQKMFKKLSQIPADQLAQIIVRAFSNKKKNDLPIKGEEKFMKLFSNKTLRFIFCNKNYHGDSWYRIFG